MPHHLEFLERHEAVVSMTQNGYLRYYPRQWEAGAFRERIGAFERRAHGLLRRRPFLHLILVLLDGGTLSVQDIRERTGLAPSTLSHRLTRLEDLSLVGAKREGRIKMHWIVDPQATVQILLKYRPTPDLIEDLLNLWEKIEL